MATPSTTAQKIIPSLWFDGNAQEAVDFYTSVFSDSTVISTSHYPTEGLADFQKDLAGEVLTIEFDLAGYRFTAINAGPDFTKNHSVSVMVNFDPSSDPDAREHIDEIWEMLAEGGRALMPLDEYPHSKRYGWVQDKFGMSWQLILTNPSGEPRPTMIPSLMFSGANVNRAEEAMNYYRSVFHETGLDAREGTVARYPFATGPATAGSLMFADFTLAGQWFVCMDSGVEQDVPFNEAVSLQIFCKDQAEIDYFWEKLSTVPEAEQCGWCKDTYGLSWQIVPEGMDQLMKQPDAFPKLMGMKKIVIADFES